MLSLASMNCVQIPEQQSSRNNRGEVTSTKQQLALPFTELFTLIHAGNNDPKPTWRREAPLSDFGLVGVGPEGDPANGNCQSLNIPRSAITIIATLDLGIRGHRTRVSCCRIEWKCFTCLCMARTLVKTKAKPFIIVRQGISHESV
jgi:hypothetical protein